MKYFAFIILVTLLSGCQNLVTQKMDAQNDLAESKRVYVACIKANNGNEKKCDVEKKIFEANVAASQNTGASPGVLIRSSQ